MSCAGALFNNVGHFGREVKVWDGFFCLRWDFYEMFSVVRWSPFLFQQDQEAHWLGILGDETHEQYLFSVRFFSVR
jgi:hypothetical protein